MSTDINDVVAKLGISGKPVRVTLLTRTTVRLDGQKETRQFPIIGAPSTVLQKFKARLAWPGWAIYHLSRSHSASHTLPDGTEEAYILKGLTMPLEEVGPWMKRVNDGNTEAAAV